MIAMTDIVGIILIVAGIGILGYKGYSYTTQETIAQIGNVQVTAQQDKQVYISPVIGGVMLIVGLALVIVVRIKK
jgi:hypothetical protein